MLFQRFVVSLLICRFRCVCLWYGRETNVVVLACILNVFGLLSRTNSRVWYICVLSRRFRDTPAFGFRKSSGTMPPFCVKTTTNVGHNNWNTYQSCQFSVHTDIDNIASSWWMCARTTSRARRIASTHNTHVSFGRQQNTAFTSTEWTCTTFATRALPLQ